jgi:DNA-binding NtrC family response regulator
LRDRKDDIPLLVSHFTARFCRELQKPEKQFAPAAVEAMVQYSWPGNVRELQHCIERLMVIVEADKILPEHLRPILTGNIAGGVAFAAPSDSTLPFPKLQIPDTAKSLEEMVNEIERQAIVNALHETKGVITEAAEKLGTTRRVLRYKMDKLGIVPSESELKKDELQTA